MFRAALLLIAVTLLVAVPVMGRGGGHGGGGHCGGHGGASHGGASHGFSGHGFRHGIGTCGAHVGGGYGSGYGFSGWEYLDRFDPTPGRDVLEDADAADAQSAPSAQYRYDHRSGGD
jgi:hypothetical protein